MGNLRKFLFLRPSERHLLLRSTLLLYAVRLGLWLLPLPGLRRLLARLRLPNPISAEGHSASTEKIAWAVAVASRYVPGATCLTQALAGQVLLTQQGEPALLQIGVAKNDAGKLEAHAWVECRGRIVIGALPEIVRYTPFPSVEGKLL